MNWVCKLLIFACFFINSFGFSDEMQEEYEFRGIHFLASYSDCDREALADVNALIEAMNNAVELCGATILEKSSWVFPPSGLTMVFLLSESHASIHTYPEHGSCFVDLFTCGVKCSSEKFDKALRAYLKPKHVIQKTLIRDQAITEKDLFVTGEPWD